MSRLFTYKANAKERIEIGYLLRASAEATARWLMENWRQPIVDDFDGWKGDTSGRHLLEFILSKRRDPIIDHALARYGYTKGAIQLAYDRGDVSTRYAAVGNPRGNIALKQISEILRTGSFSLITELLQNPFLPGRFFENLFGRKEEFSDIDDQRFLTILYRIAGSPRLSRARDDTFFDGYAEHAYDKAFQATWNLAKTVPTDQHWAGALWEILRRCERPQSGGIDNLDQAIERWRIDRSFVDKSRRWERSQSFYVRTLLAGFLRADQDLLNSDDPALRSSFYRRFSPLEFRDWPAFIAKVWTRICKCSFGEYRALEEC